MVRSKCHGWIVACFATFLATKEHSALGFQPQFKCGHVSACRAHHHHAGEMEEDNATPLEPQSRREWLSFVVSGGVAVFSTPHLYSTAAWADELGKETEAPTLFTGENIMICKKRGPLGACTQQVIRTAENDNDKASKYFRDPEIALREQLAQQKEKQRTKDTNDDDDDNVLIQQLREKTNANKERNRRIVKQKTLQNDQAAAFSPLDRQVVILSADGESFSLLESPVAMRLKKMGLINGQRQFVREPTDEEYKQALTEVQENEESLLGSLLRKVSGGGGEDDALVEPTTPSGGGGEADAGVGEAPPAESNEAVDELDIEM